MKIDLQRIPRTAIYLVLLLCLSIPYFVQWSLPVYVSRATKSLYKAVEEVHRKAPQTPVMLLSSWDPSSRGENRPQLVAIIRHLLILKQPFLLFSPTINPMAPRASEEVLNSELERAKREWAAITNAPFALMYGQNYANLGFKGVAGTNIGPILQQLEGDFMGCVVKDLYGTPVQEIPMLRNFRSLADASMIITISGDIEAEHVISTFSPSHPEIPVGAAGWSLICTRLYPYFDTRQLAGILDGMNGASEYLTYLGQHYPSAVSAEEGEDGSSSGSSKRVNALTLARVLIIVLIVMGNVGMLLEQRRKKLGLPLPEPPKAANVGEKHWLNVAGLAFTLLFLLALAGEYCVRRQAGLDGGQVLWSSSVLGEWVAVFCTIGMLSFIFGDNKLYRVLEHVIVGSSAAYMLYEVIDKQIMPSFASKVAAGFAALSNPAAGTGSPWDLLLLLGIIPSLLWFTTGIKALAWTNKLVLGLLMGVASGIAIGQNVNLAVPQIVGSMKPLLTIDKPVQECLVSFGPRVCITWSNVMNLLYLVTMVLVMLYFVFCLKQKSFVAKGSLRLGRIIMMVAFGAVFGNTIATRMSWLIDRIDALAAWLGTVMLIGGPK